MENDTIAGIASGMGGGIGIIRISGDHALRAVGEVFRTQKFLKSENKKWDADFFQKQETHTIHYGFITDGDSVVDEVIVLLMKAPKSYTCEDVVEIDSHGGAFVLQNILKLLLKHGVRLSEPGEFTKRAFLNGRIDLSQAEAVMKMISSRSEFALDTAVKQLEGGLSKYIEAVREELLFHMGYIEAALDDPEHYSLDDYSEKLKIVVKEQMEKLETLLKNFDNGRMKSEGINTVIVGKPNAGKSSFMNLLLEEDRAIVTNVAGTTRDILEESVRFGDLILNLIDTAGIRQTDNLVESIGVKKAVEYIEQADFIIYIVDILDSFDSEDQKIISLLKKKKGVILYNKYDKISSLANGDTLENLSFVTDSDDKKLSDTEIQKSGLNENGSDDRMWIESELSNHFLDLDWKSIAFSAKEGLGLKELENYMKELFLEGNLAFNDQVYLTSLRHKDAVESARDSLKEVLVAIEHLMPEDILMVDLMDAYKSLGLINGDTASEDLVNKIFEEFCMGK